MKVSVIIPVKNRPEVILRAIGSAFAQSVRPYEVIVVDDGSTDQTPEVVEELMQSEPALKLIRNESSSGAPTARNQGAYSAEGDLLAFLDSDDCWKENKLESQLKLLQMYPQTPAVFTGFEFHYGDRQKKTSRTPETVARSDLYSRNVLGGCSSALVRRDVFAQVGGFKPEMPSCQDWELWLRLADIGDLKTIPEPLVVYYFDGGMRISKNRENVENGHNMIFGLLQDEIDKRPDSGVVKAHQHLRMAEVYLKQFDDISAVITSLGRAIISSPSPGCLFLVFKRLAQIVYYKTLVRESGS